jgi:hypothetical protein
MARGLAGHPRDQLLRQVPAVLYTIFIVLAIIALLFFIFGRRR